MSLESFRIQPLRLDHIDAHIPDRFIAHELDSAGRILRVQLTDGGDVRDTTGASLSLAWKHQRGASGLEPFSVVDAATGVYEVTYPSTMMLDGVATCSIQVADADSLAATRNFHVRIQDSPIDEDTTASTETWTLLELILTQGQAAVTALEEQHTEQATEFADALAGYQAQIDAAAASATEVYIGTGAPHENAVLWIDTTGGGKRVKSLVDGQWVEPTAEVMRPFDADTLGGVAPSGYQRANSCPFPIGYIVTNQGEDPATQWAGTTWERYAEGRVLVGQDAAQTEFDTIGKTGGAKTHTLTVDEIPPHGHEIPVSGTAYPERKALGTTAGLGADWGSSSGGTMEVGGGAAHNNLQPYVVVAHWRRTA